jgi:hypothetical protein
MGFPICRWLFRLFTDDFPILYMFFRWVFLATKNSRPGDRDADGMAEAQCGWLRNG